jgi:hypothetical protein
MIGEPTELRLSNRITVSVAELDGYESMRADKVLADLLGNVIPGGNIPVMAMALLQMKVYAICSIRKVEGESVDGLKNMAEHASIASKLNPQEMNALQAWAQPRYQPTEDESKNEPSALS